LYLFFLTITDQTQGNYIFVTSRASKRAKTNHQLLNPFLTLKYDTDGFNLDELDVVNKPAYVIPISTLRTQLVETNPRTRKRILFTAIPYAFFHRDDWQDLSRGLTWSETEVLEGESKRLIGYRCDDDDRNTAMDRCTRFLIPDLAVPEKETLQWSLDRFLLGESVVDIFSEEDIEENRDDEDDNDLDPERDEFDFAVDEGLDTNDITAIDALVR
jgi:hypothetical protein